MQNLCGSEQGAVRKANRNPHSRPQGGGFQGSHNPVVLVYPGSSVTSWVLLKFGFEFVVVAAVLGVFFAFAFGLFFFFFLPQQICMRWAQGLLHCHGRGRESTSSLGLSTKFEANAKSLDTRSRPGKSQWNRFFQSC